MRAGGDGAPARQAARYGLRWRARDMARQAGFRMARASFPELLGTFWLIAGLVLILAVWASGPIDGWGFAPAGFMLAAGAGLLIVAQARGRRR